VYERKVRRRRAILGVLVGLSLVLLTFYFGESTSGGLHSVQRGALQVLGPIQEGASRVLKPMRDLVGWVGDTFDAKNERDKLAKERDALEKQVTELQAAVLEGGQLKALQEANTTAGLSRYEPVKARVVARSPNLFYSTITIDKGRSAGVQHDQPVVAANGALVGRVTSVTPGYSTVTLITDENFAVAARSLASGQMGTVQPELGSRGDLVLDLVNDPRVVRKGERIVTAGSLSPKLESYYPPNITIGKVSRVEMGEGDLDRKIHISPMADVRALLWVEVLTKSASPQLQANATPGP
jgi:rod shape-determining protein MreC